VYQKKNAIFAKIAILANFYFALGGFQCTAKGIFIPKYLKLGTISTKKTCFSKKGLFLLLFKHEYLGKIKS